MIKGLLVKPYKAPEIIEFSEEYGELQKLVEGYIEMPYLFDDVDIVINEEGKLIGLEPNVYIYDDNDLVDVIVGNIVVVGHNDEGETISLTDEQIDKYTKVFANKELFL